MTNHPRSWFKIGKTVKRDALSCPCSMCSVPATITIKDEFTAKYLFDVQNDLDIKYYE